MYVCMYMYICIYFSIHLSLYISLSLSIYIYICAGEDIPCAQPADLSPASRGEEETNKQHQSTNNTNKTT